MCSPISKRMYFLRRRNEELLSQLQSNSIVLERRLKQLRETARAPYTPQTQSKERKCKLWSQRNNSGQVSAALRHDLVQTQCNASEFNGTKPNGAPHAGGDLTTTSPEEDSHTITIPSRRRMATVTSSKLCNSLYGKQSQRSPRHVPGCYGTFYDKPRTVKKRKRSCVKTCPLCSGLDKTDDPFRDLNLQKKTLEAARDLISYSPQSTFLRGLKARSLVDLNKLGESRPRLKCTCFAVELSSESSSETEIEIQQPIKIRTKPSDVSRLTRKPSSLKGSTHSLLRGSTHSPLKGSTHSPLKGSTHSPCKGSTHTPLKGSTHSPSKGSTRFPLKSSTHSPLRVSTHKSRGITDATQTRRVSKSSVGREEPRVLKSKSSNLKTRSSNISMRGERKSSGVRTQTKVTRDSENVDPRLTRGKMSRTTKPTITEGSTCDDDSSSFNVSANPSSRRSSRIKSSNGKLSRPSTTAASKKRKHRGTCVHSQPQGYDVLAPLLDNQRDLRGGELDSLREAQRRSRGVAETESESRQDRVDVKEDNRVDRLSEFRRSNWFDTHAHPASTDMLTDSHECIHRYIINDRLFATPIYADNHNRSRCMQCHLPRDEAPRPRGAIPPDERPPDARPIDVRPQGIGPPQLNPSLSAGDLRTLHRGMGTDLGPAQQEYNVPCEALSKPRREHIRVTLPQRVLPRPAELEPTQGGFHISGGAAKCAARDLRGVAAACMLQHPIRSRPAVMKPPKPAHSLALRFQKGMV